MKKKPPVPSPHSKGNREFLLSQFFAVDLEKEGDLFSISRDPFTYIGVGEDWIERNRKGEERALDPRKDRDWEIIANLNEFVSLKALELFLDVIRKKQKREIDWADAFE